MTFLDILESNMTQY